MRQELFKLGKASNMARFQRFQGTQSLPGVRTPGVVADTAVGAATAQLGRQFGQSAAAVDNLAARARKREKNLKEFEAAKSEERRILEAKAKRAEERQNERSAPTGLSEGMLDFIESTEISARQGASDDTGQGYPNKAGFSKEQLLQDFAADEAADGEAYLLRGIETSKEFAISEIRDKPHSIDQSLARLAALVDIAPLPLAKKEVALRLVTETLAETWLETLPPEDQIAGLAQLRSKRDAVGETTDVEAGATGLQSDQNVQTEAELPALFEARAQLLPPYKQNKLLLEAMKKKAAIGYREEARIASQIAENPFLLDPREIRDNGNLEEGQKTQLLSDQQDQIEEQEKGLEAINLLSRPENRESDLRKDSGLAERAYKALDTDRFNKDEFVEILVHNKGQVPPSYLAEISHGIRNQDASKVAASFAKLKRLESAAPGRIFRGGANLATQKALEIWNGLAETKGLPEEKAAEWFSKDKFLGEVENRKINK